MSTINPQDRESKMVKYKYNITFEKRDIDGVHYINDYITLEASSFDSVIKKFKKQYGNCEIVVVCRL